MADLSSPIIAYISQAPLDGPGIGGGARVKTLYDLFESLSLKVNLVAYDFYSSNYSIKKNNMHQDVSNVTLRIPLKTPRILKFFALFPASIYFFKACKKSDVILADFNNILGSIPAVIFGKLLKKPVILDCIDTKLIRVIPNFVYRFIAINAEAIFAISHHLVDFFVSNYGCKNVIYLPIFVDTDLFKFDDSSRNWVRNELNLSSDEKVIGYVGSFTYYEGVKNLFLAFKNLKKDFPKIKLAVMGKIYWREYDDDVEKLTKELNLEDSVILLPACEHREVPKIISAFDILCCPKIDHEINRAANPVKVVEYLSMGLPTVSSAIGDIPYIIKNKKNGILTKPGDVKDLEDKLRWLLLNPQKAREIGLNGRKTIVYNYSYNAMRNNMQNIIRDIWLENKRR